jgi:hypothetical protein
MKERIFGSRFVEQLLERMDADAAFGASRQVGDVVVIPVADVRVALGHGQQEGPGGGSPVIVKLQEFSAGSGHVTTGRSPDVEGEGSSEGSGGRGQVRPRGYIQVGPEGVSFQDMIDIDRLGLAGIAMVAWCGFWIARMAQAIAKYRSRAG